jgi:hypothetical protein
MLQLRRRSVAEFDIKSHRGAFPMRTQILSLASLLTLAAAGATSAQAHSAYEARDVLRNHGFYDIQNERVSSLPYSFIACKEGTRYHLHVSYQGEVEQADEVGQCRGHESHYEYRRPHHNRHYGNGYGYGSRRWSRDSY